MDALKAGTTLVSRPEPSWTPNRPLSCRRPRCRAPRRRRCFEMIRIVYRNPLELWGEPSYNEPWISVSRGRRAAGHRQRSRADPPRARRQRQELQARDRPPEDPAADPARRAADGRRQVWRRSRKAMAPIFTPRHIFGFARPDAEARRGIRRTLRARVLGEHRRRLARHDHAHLRDPCRDAVFRRDRRRGRRVRAPDRPAVRDDGPRRPARPAARAGLAAAHHAAARPQDHGLLPPHRRRDDRDAQRAPGARARRGAGRFPDAAAAQPKGPTG